MNLAGQPHKKTLHQNIQWTDQLLIVLFCFRGTIMFLTIIFQDFLYKKFPSSLDFKIFLHLKLRNVNILFSKHWNKMIDVYPCFSLYPAQQKQFGKVYMQLWDVWKLHKLCMVFFYKIERWEVTSVQWSRKVRGFSQIFEGWWIDVQWLMKRWCSETMEKLCCCKDIG